VGLADIVRGAVAIANNVTSSLQAIVTHEAWIGSDKYGKPIYDSPISRPAIVDRKTASIGGQQIVQNTSVTFIYPITAQGAADRQEPVDPRDRITLPDGWTGPIVNVNGLVDPLTGMPYLYQVSLGNPGGV
jgi:hypothetical protein